MFGEAGGFSSSNRYQIHPMKTVVTMLSGSPEDGDSWTLGENELKVTENTVHLGITGAGRKASEINTTERIS